jgi:hypothetical protein
MSVSLAQFWKQEEFAQPPYIHPCDLEILNELAAEQQITQPVLSLNEAVKRFHSAPHKLDLSLLPVPYGGDVERADIVILFLNPSLSVADSYTESPLLSYRAAHLRTIKQTGSGKRFLWLDPEFAWHGGFSYWEGKLRKTIQVIARERCDGDYAKALSELAKRLAVIQLVPYRSPQFTLSRLIPHLPSSRAALSFARTHLQQAVKRKEKTVIVLRKPNVWGLDGVVAYTRGQRAAGLGPDTDGGRAILKRFDL